MELLCFEFANVVTKHAEEKESALSKEIHFGALVLVASGLGVLLFVGASIFFQQRTSATESDDVVCIAPAVLVVDASGNYSCETTNVISSPTMPASTSPQITISQSPVPSPSDIPIAVPTTAPSLTSDAKPSATPSPTVTTSVPVEPSSLLNPDGNLSYAKYSKSPKVKSKIGTLKLKELNKSMPIIEGSGKSSLKLGAGHYVDSVLPGMKDNSVIAGHRETVFRSLGKLKIGHHVIATTSAGTFTYQVTGTRIVDDEDRTVIVPTTEATLTLITCYPFEAYGPKPQRYIVSAQLISSKLKK